MRVLRALVAVVFLIPMSAAVDDMGERLATFHRHYDVFMRAFLGCPKHAREVEECEQKLGTIDYAEYFKARKAAEALFDLRPK